MQFEVDIQRYKRKENKKIKRRVNLQATPIKLIAIVLVGAMLGRVNFSFIEALVVAPFGIAYLLSIIIKEDYKQSIYAFGGVVLGYLTVFSEDTLIYILVAVGILTYGLIAIKLENKPNKKVLFSIVVAMFVMLGIFVGNQGAMVNLAFSFIKAISIIPLFYVVSYGVNCISEVRTNYFFSTEELISIAILLCLIVAGIGNVSIMGVDIRGVAALSMLLIIAYAGGSSVGAIMGVTMGLILGIANNDMLLSISLYGACGLVVGVFKETGKVFTLLAYFASYFIVISQSMQIGVDDAVKVIIPTIVLLAMPSKFIENIFNEINNNEKANVVTEMQLEGIKSEFIDKLGTMKSVLSTISSSLNNLSENEKLLFKNKGTAMVESLADRVCSTCELNRKCWERELHNTYIAFGELIRSCEERNPKFPKELQKKCVKTNTLLKNADDLLNTNTINETLKSRLVEGRKLLANQINNMSLSMGDVIRNFEKDVNSCLDIDRLLRKNLIKNNVKYDEIYSYTDTKGRLKIKVKMNNCDGCSYCLKKVLPTVSDLLRAPLALSDEGCKIDPKTNKCSIVIEETPKYHIASYVSFSPKDGEKYSGDSFSFGKNRNGTYITAISDGMGSGPEAGLESSIAIELVEKFLDSGFDESTTLNVVNSIMSMKFNEDEKFTTLDMNAVDLYTGETSFIKVGGVMSFIKKGSEIELIESSGLPFGIVDEIDVEPIKRKMKHGDIIVTISDGILDADRDNIGDYKWLEEYISKGSTNPEALSREILDRAKEIGKGKIFDDMTVVVSKMYSVY